MKIEDEEEERRWSVEPSWNWPACSEHHLQAREVAVEISKVPHSSPTRSTLENTDNSRSTEAKGHVSGIKCITLPMGGHTCNISRDLEILIILRARCNRCSSGFPHHHSNIHLASTGSAQLQPACSRSQKGITSKDWIIPEQSSSLALINLPAIRHHVHCRWIAEHRASPDVGRVHRCRPQCDYAKDPYGHSQERESIVAASSCPELTM